VQAVQASSPPGLRRVADGFWQRRSACAVNPEPLNSPRWAAVKAGHSTGLVRRRERAKAGHGALAAIRVDLNAGKPSGALWLAGSTATHLLAPLRSEIAAKPAAIRPRRGPSTGKCLAGLGRL